MVPVHDPCFLYVSCTPSCMLTYPSEEGFSNTHGWSHRWDYWSTGFTRHSWQLNFTFARLPELSPGLLGESFRELLQKLLLAMRFHGWSHRWDYWSTGFTRHSWQHNFTIARLPELSPGLLGGSFGWLLRGLLRGLLLAMRFHSWSHRWDYWRTGFTRHSWQLDCTFARLPELSPGLLGESFGGLLQGLLLAMRFPGWSHRWDYWSTGFTRHSWQLNFTFARLPELSPGLLGGHLGGYCEGYC